MTNYLIARTRGHKLTKREREELIIKLVDLLTTGYKTDSELAEQLQISRVTLNTLKPFADELLAVTADTQNVIRNQSIARVNRQIERITKHLEDGKLTFKEQMFAISTFTRLQSHLAMITGLNVETKINIDHKRLVVIRAHPDAVHKAISNEIEVTPRSAEE